MTTDTIMTCYAHPGREATLRCKRCERPICTSCAVHTPTGYLCKDCVRAHQKSFETAEWYDFVVGFITAAFLSGVAAFLVTLIGFIGFWGLLLLVGGAPVAGTAITEAVRYVTRRHRSKSLFITVAIGVVIGALPVMAAQLLIMNIFGIIFQIVYLVIAVPFVYARLSGIQFNR